MYTLQLLQGIAPFVAGLCLDNFIRVQGELCNFRESSPPKITYSAPEKSCYVDGIFYPRCADYDNPEVKYYHNLLKNK